MRRLIPASLSIAAVLLSWQAQATIARQQPAQQPAASDVKLLWQFEAGG